jgi:hypothetical protein
MTKYNLKKVGLDTIEEYYQLILDTKNAHDHTKAVELFTELTRKQVDEFLSYVVENYDYDPLYVDEESGGVVLISEIEELCKYFNIKL